MNPDRYPDPGSPAWANRPDAATRRPYVGHGADGARRSAQIDREEADTIDTGDEWGRRERDRLLASAERWEAQADTLAHRTLDTLATESQEAGLYDEMNPHQPPVIDLYESNDGSLYLHRHGDTVAWGDVSFAIDNGTTFAEDAADLATVNPPHDRAPDEWYVDVCPVEELRAASEVRHLASWDDGRMRLYDRPGIHGNRYLGGAT